MTISDLSNGQLKEEMHCLICDADVATHSGYSVLYTVLPNGGSLLCDNIKKVLRRDLDVVTTRSSIICNRCFSLFDELAVAENRYVGLKKEIESYYVKTCEIYNDEDSLSIRGVACQTDSLLESVFQGDENRPDIKLKIAIPKRKRGRPFKAETQKRRNSVVNNQESLDEFDRIETAEKSKKKEKPTKPCPTDSSIDGMNEVSPDSRRTRSGARGSSKKKSVTIIVADMEKDKSIKGEDVDEKEAEKSSDDVDFINMSDNSFKVEENCHDNGEVLDPDFFNKDDDNDDFEWKEEPIVELNEESTESEDEIKDEKTANEEDWQSSSSKDGKKRLKKKKKRKRGDRKGERAFMVPIHECNQCGKKWRTVTELKSHVASHSDVRPFVCEICGQAYKMKKALDIHIGMHNGIHPFVCSYCNKSFTQKVGLEKHLPIHTGVTRFQCDLCGKRFIHQKSFNIHKMTHTGEKNIHCPICKLAVFSQSHLKRHYRVHTGERPYGCNICGKKFAEKYNLNAHARIHDPNSAGEGRRRCHTCPICGVTYDRKHKMADHLSSAHYIWQTSASLDFKSEDFYNMDVQQGQHHLQPLVSQHSPSMQVPPQQQHVHQQQQQQPPSISQAAQQAQQSAQMTATHQPQQHHHMSHHQPQTSSHHMQQHHTQTGAPPPHHILVTQHQLQQSLQTHLSHHPAATAATAVVAAATPPPLQPMNPVFQLVSVQSTPGDPSTSHHNRMNTVSASMPVPTL